MKILIVCTGNTCRSSMAEGIFRALINKYNLDIEVSSAGTNAFDGDDASDYAIATLKEMGIDISNHKARLIHEDLVNEADFILTMTNIHKQNIILKFSNANGKIYLLNEFAFGETKDILDPFGGGIEYYEKARDEILIALEAVIRIMNKE